LSDLFGLSEYHAAEILIEAEEQMQNFHGLNRGLIAILLYFDCKKLILNILKALILSCPGRTWVLDENMPDYLVKFLNEFISSFMRDNIIEKLLSK
jgi:nuclear pore complex protein Nup205